MVTLSKHWPVYGLLLYKMFPLLRVAINLSMDIYFFLFQVIIAISWIASLIKNIPKFSLVFYKSDVISCKYTEEWIGKVYFSALFSINAFSFMLIAGLYSRVMYTLWFQRPENDDLRTTQQHLRVSSRSNNALCLIV